MALSNKKASVSDVEQNIEVVHMYEKDGKTIVMLAIQLAGLWQSKFNTTHVDDS